MKQFSNICHYFVGFVWLYAIGNLTNTSTFDLYGKFMAVVVSIFLGAFFGWIIEQVQFYFTDEQKPYLDDIVRTSIGGLFGGLMAVLFPKLNLFMWISLGVTAILSAVELILLYKIYKQRK